MRLSGMGTIVTEAGKQAQKELQQRINGHKHSIYTILVAGPCSMNSMLSHFRESQSEEVREAVFQLIDSGVLGFTASRKLFLVN